MADLGVSLVTDAKLCGSRGVVETVRQAVEGGVRAVQLRDKAASDAAVVEQLVALAETIDGRALLLVDDRLGALVEARRRGARVDGIHLGQSDVPVVEARAVLGPDAVIGLTANAPEHLDAVRAMPAGTVDYLGVGVIHPTATKPDHPPALGVDGFGEFAAASPLPCVAIGGIGAGDVAALRAAGAAGVAFVSAICAAADPRASARELRRAWRRPGPPRVLTIAGSDPSGGAGIQADLKAIAAAGGYGMAAITALTAQNTRGVSAVHVPPAEFLRAQLDALSDDIEIDAVKIGMLADAGVARTVADWLRQERPGAVVLDPVMIATSGDRLLDTAAEDALRALLPLADVITPNLPELAVLAGARAAVTWGEALDQARRLASESGALVLAKGGHLPGADVPDALVGSDGVIAEFTGPRVETANTHGTGCSLSSALATRRAHGETWPDAAAAARRWLRAALRSADGLGVGRGHGPIDHSVGLRAVVPGDPVPVDPVPVDAVPVDPVPVDPVPVDLVPVDPDLIEPVPADPEPVEAEAVMRDWWDRIAGIRDDIDRLPFIRALADGTLAEAAFLWYLAQDAVYLRAYSRVLAAASQLAPDPAAQAFWAGCAQGAIAGEARLHAAWLSPGQPADAFDAEPASATVAYLDHLRAVAFDGDYAVLIAAVLPCFWLYDDLGARLHAGGFGAAPLDPAHPFASWLATYADPAFAASTRQAVEVVGRAAAGADPDTRERMRIAFERSARHELAFFAAPG